MPDAMKTVYLSSFCVDFRDYERLEELIRSCASNDVLLGVELATSWNYPDFDENLEAQTGRFRGVPVTLHSPFVETCVEAGSEAEQRMTAMFEKAFRWYHLFDATSMVVHTHQNAFPPELRAEKQRRSEEVILQTAEWAGREGVCLTVENVGYPLKKNVLFDQGEYVELIRRLPREVGALIDTGHAMANGWDIPGLIETLGDRIRGYHLHNTDEAHDLHRPVYERGWNYSAEQMDDLLRCIHRFSPDADLILEYAPGPHICRELFDSELRRMRSVWEDQRTAWRPGKEE